MQQRHTTWENFKKDLSRGDPIVQPIEQAPEDAPKCKIFADENNGRIGLRVSISEAPEEVDLALQHIQTATVFEGSQLFFEVFTSASPLYEPFYAMLTRMADLIQLNGHEPLAALSESVDQFATLLSSPTVLSREKQVGLWGELWLLRKLIDVHGADALGYWTGPLGEDHDFRFADDEIEVKTTTKSTRSHIISKLSQLEASPGRTLYLLSIQLAAGQGDDACSLLELVEDLRRRLASNSGAEGKFRELLKEAEYNVVHEAFYSDVRLLRSEPMLIKVDTGVPRITSELLSEGLGAEKSSRIS